MEQKGWADYQGISGAKMSSIFNSVDGISIILATNASGEFLLCVNSNFGILITEEEYKTLMNLLNAGEPISELLAHIKNMNISYPNLES